MLGSFPRSAGRQTDRQANKQYKYEIWSDQILSTSSFIHSFTHSFTCILSTMLCVGHVKLDNIWQPRNYFIGKKVSEQHISISFLWSFHFIHFNSLALNAHWSKYKLLNMFFPTSSRFFCVCVGRDAHMSLGVSIWLILVWFLGQWFANIPSCAWKLPGWLVTFRFRCFTPRSSDSLCLCWGQPSVL